MVTVTEGHAWLGVHRAGGRVRGAAPRCPAVPPAVGGIRRCRPGDPFVDRLLVRVVGAGEVVAAERPVPVGADPVHVASPGYIGLHCLTLLTWPVSSSTRMTYGEAPRASSTE